MGNVFIGIEQKVKLKPTTIIKTASLGIFLLLGMKLAWYWISNSHLTSTELMVNNFRTLVAMWGFMVTYLFIFGWETGNR